MKHITAITTEQQAYARRTAWRAALHDSSNLITPRARTRSLTNLKPDTGKVDDAARNLLRDGGFQQGGEPFYSYSLTDYNRDVQTLLEALDKA